MATVWPHPSLAGCARRLLVATVTLVLVLVMVVVGLVGVARRVGGDDAGLCIT